jgi:excisionase family DNA binding protein
MSNQILQLEKTNAIDFKNQIVTDVTIALKDFAENLNKSDENQLLTRQQVADLFSVSLVTIWDWTRKDILPAYKIGNKVRFKKGEVLLALQKSNKF